MNPYFIPAPVYPHQQQYLPYPNMYPAQAGVLPRPLTQLQGASLRLRYAEFHHRLDMNARYFYHQLWQWHQFRGYGQSVTSGSYNSWPQMCHPAQFAQLGVPWPQMQFSSSTDTGFQQPQFYNETGNSETHESETFAANADTEESEDPQKQFYNEHAYDEDEEVQTDVQQRFCVLKNSHRNRNSSGNSNVSDSMVDIAELDNDDTGKDAFCSAGGENYIVNLPDSEEENPEDKNASETELNYNVFDLSIPEGILAFDTEDEENQLLDLCQKNVDNIIGIEEKFRDIEEKFASLTQLHKELFETSS